jgi:hypothetical protein
MLIFLDGVAWHEVVADDDIIIIIIIRFYVNIL